MIAYFDMDGVLVDLYGVLGRAWGVDPHSLKDHAGDTPDKYRKWVWENGGPLRAFEGLPPLHLEKMKGFMRELKGQGHCLEILSSVGDYEPFHQGVMLAKRGWLLSVYVWGPSSRGCTLRNQPCRWGPPEGSLCGGGPVAH